MSSAEITPSLKRTGRPSIRTLRSVPFGFVMRTSFPPASALQNCKTFYQPPAAGLTLPE